MMFTANIACLGFNLLTPCEASRKGKCGAHGDCDLVEVIQEDNGAGVDNFAARLSTFVMVHHPGRTSSPR